jgi:hypothetical protein
MRAIPALRNPGTRCAIPALRNPRTSASRRTRLNSRPGSPPMIAKTFLMAKTFHAYGDNFFRQEKSLRDHGDERGGPV